MRGNITEAVRSAVVKRRGRGVAMAVGLVACSALVWQSSHASFSDVTSNDGNTIGAGTVDINDNDSGTAMFDTGVTPVAPGYAPTPVCMGVTYAGTLPAGSIRMYLPQASAFESDAGGSYIPWASPRTAELADNSTLRIEMNDTDLNTNPNATCTGNFTDVVAATNLKTLITTKESWANGFVLPTIAQGKYRSFRFTYVLSSSTPNTAQGDGVKYGITWEARQ